MSEHVVEELLDVDQVHFSYWRACAGDHAHAARSWSRHCSRRFGSAARMIITGLEIHHSLTHQAHEDKICFWIIPNFQIIIQSWLSLGCLAMMFSSRKEVALEGDFRRYPVCPLSISSIILHNSQFNERTTYRVISRGEALVLCWDQTS